MDGIDYKGLKVILESHCSSTERAVVNLNESATRLSVLDRFETSGAFDGDPNLIATLTRLETLLHTHAKAVRVFRRELIRLNAKARGD